MKNRIKYITLGLLFCFTLTLCGCKDRSDTSSTAQSSNSVVQNTENIPENDAAIHPENTGLGRPSGTEVAAESLKPVEGKANGIDVSKWQGKIDWKRVKASGIDFAVIRIGYRAENGVIYRDANADYNIQQAQKSGLLIGVYFFSTAVNEAEAREEAEWTATAVKGYKISYPVVYDCEGYTNETSRMYGISAQIRTNNALAFLKYITSCGYVGMMYGAKNEIENPVYWDMPRIEQGYKVWVAHYSTPAYPEKQNPDYSRKYDMWQYTNRGTVNGVEGNCDMIVSYFKPTEAAPKDSSAAPSVAEAPKTQEDLNYTDVSDSVTAKQEVNLREGASTKYNVVATLKSGEFVTRTGIGKNGWSRLIYNGKTVYAVTNYLTDKVIEAPKEDIVNGIKFTPASDKMTAKQEVNLRALPTTDSEIVGKLTSGTFLERTAVSDRGWSRLSFNGTAVYAVTSYLSDTVPEASTDNTVTSTRENDSIEEHGVTFKKVDSSLTAKEETNLRDKPTTVGSNVVYTLKNGEYVRCVGISSSGWARLEYNGQTVYAVASYLTE